MLSQPALARTVHLTIFGMLQVDNKRSWGSAFRSEIKVDREQVQGAIARAVIGAW